MILKLTDEQRRIMDKFPEDSTDWSGIGDEVMLQILDDYEKAKKWDEQKYIYEKNFDKITIDITEAEYEKFSSVCVCMTWLANELNSENQKLRELIEKWLKEDSDEFIGLDDELSDLGGDMGDRIEDVKLRIYNRIQKLLKDSKK